MTWFRIFMEEIWKQLFCWFALVVLASVLVIVAWWWFVDTQLEIPKGDYDRVSEIKRDTGREVEEFVVVSMQDGMISKREYAVICLMHDKWHLRQTKWRLQQ